MFWYKLGPDGMPIAMARQPQLQFFDELAARPAAAELFLICRRQQRA